MKMAIPLPCANELEGMTKHPLSVHFTTDVPDYGKRSAADEPDLKTYFSPISCTTGSPNLRAINFRNV